MKQVRIRFKVPELQYYNTLAFTPFDRRLWVEILLTYLCCPDNDHPAVARCGVRTSEVLRHLVAGGAHPRGSEALTTYDFRWPHSLQTLVDPGLAVAELEFGPFLAILWAWAYSPTQTINVNLAARLAAFSAKLSGGAPIAGDYCWAEIRDWAPVGVANMSPFDMFRPEPFDCTILPWVVRIKGVK